MWNLMRRVDREATTEWYEVNGSRISVLEFGQGMFERKILLDTSEHAIVLTKWEKSMTRWYNGWLRVSTYFFHH